jgi:hypothetical protein
MSVSPLALAWESSVTHILQVSPSSPQIVDVTIELNIFVNPAIILFPNTDLYKLPPLSQMLEN